MMLSARIAGRQFAGKPVLAPLAFTLGAREILAIVGPSGCGKSTLLRIVGGLDRGCDGTLAWDGGGPPRIGTVFQEPRLLPWRTVRQNLDLVRPAGHDPAPGDALLRRLGLWPARDMFAGNLSVGMARRLALARAFVVDPALVLLDEPFVSLDEAAAAEARQVLLDAWRHRPLAALLVTHDLVEAASLADRILMLGGSPTRIVRTVAVSAEQRRACGAAAIALAETIRRAAADHGFDGA